MILLEKGGFFFLKGPDINDFFFQRFFYLLFIQCNFFFFDLCMLLKHE